MSQDFLIDEPVEGVRRITINRPEAMNSFTYPMYTKLLEILEEIKFTPQVRVVILTATGRGFCTGHDLRVKDSPDWVPDGVGKAFFNRYAMSVISSIPVALRNLPQPIICGANGTVAGMALAYTLSSDITIAAHSAKFVNSIHNAGSGAELGISYMLPRAIGTQRAAELLLTSRQVLAEEAARIGLVLKSVPDEELQDACVELAQSIAANVPMGIWVTKQSLWSNQHAGSLEHAIEFESRGVFIAQSTEDKQEKQTAFFEKRAPKFTFK